MKIEDNFSEGARIDDPEHALEGELVDIDVVAEALESSQEFPEVPVVDGDEEVDFDKEDDPSFQKELKPFSAVKVPPKRDPVKTRRRVYPCKALARNG